jgi:hypothetical protein
MRNQTVICDFCGRPIIEDYLVLKTVAGSGHLVMFPENQDVCPECVDAILAVKRRRQHENGQHEPGGR